MNGLSTRHWAGCSPHGRYNAPRANNREGVTTKQSERGGVGVHPNP